MSQRSRAPSLAERHAGTQAPEAADVPMTMCSFCEERPTGSEGHAGLAQQAYKIPLTERALVRLACVFCGTNWVRQRIRSKVYEWLRVAR